MVYEVEITRFVPALEAEKSIGETPGDVVNRLPSDATLECVVFVAAIDRERKLDWGNFYIWWNADRALIRHDEHCEHRAVDPDSTDNANPEVQFKDEDGTCFSVPYRHTVSRGQALEALNYWLPSQEHSPKLRWSSGYA